MSKSKSKQLTEEIDEYLCHRRFCELSLKFGDTSSVTCQPHKNHWLISHYQNYNLKRQEAVNEWREVLVKFRDYCIISLMEENLMLRRQEKTGERVFPDLTPDFQSKEEREALAELAQISIKPPLMNPNLMRD